MQIAQGCSAEQLESTIRAAGGQTEFFQVHFLRLFFKNIGFNFKAKPKNSGPNPLNPNLSHKNMLM